MTGAAGGVVGMQLIVVAHVRAARRRISIRTVPVWGKWCCSLGLTRSARRRKLRLAANSCDR